MSIKAAPKKQSAPDNRCGFCPERPRSKPNGFRTRLAEVAPLRFCQASLWTKKQERCRNSIRRPEGLRRTARLSEWRFSARRKIEEEGGLMTANSFKNLLPGTERVDRRHKTSPALRNGRLGDPAQALKAAVTDLPGSSFRIEEEELGDTHLGRLLHQNSRPLWPEDGSRKSDAQRGLP